MMTAYNKNSFLRAIPVSEEIAKKIMKGSHKGYEALRKSLHDLKWVESLNMYKFSTNFTINSAEDYKSILDLAAKYSVKALTGELNIQDEFFYKFLLELIAEFTK